MARAIDVARFLVHLANNEEEPDYLTPLRLQKLLYYIQAWSLVQREEAIFPDCIEAWAHGPVVPSVYNTFSEHGFRPILPADIGDAETELTSDETQFIDSVWETYKGYSATKLREMTHEEAPWVDARKGFGPADRCSEEITKEAIRKYFSTIPTG